MERACFVMRLRPGQEKEYERRHDEIWPEMDQRWQRWMSDVIESITDDGDLFWADEVWHLD
jgi:L-rhamnose mutarotase